MTTLGKLYVVATPIGNLNDISARCQHILQQVDWILAEDTRHSIKLFNQLNIAPKVISYHDHNEKVMVPRLLERLISGETGALISDAGTPLISDPGFLLVKSAHEHNIPVSPIPGPCALIAALSASGLPCDQFSFIGFLPPKTLKRQSKLQALQKSPHTLIFYEAPHRIQACLEDMLIVFGPNRNMTLARELTKMHEQIVTKPIREIKEALENGLIPLKGEMVMIVSGEAVAEKEEPVIQSTLQILLPHLPLKQAVLIASELTGIKKNTVYQAALAMSGLHPDET
ncbi:MAG TPA: 16S rRNA (cytidine(1402)-2'-O)-methyltransferase [Gammaproteobacteria bacterium]|nr:16S rRNA (cytidine(1402)-2'-O)-methyltransferase [Gammaproteobacteria bacterium]